MIEAMFVGILFAVSGSASHVDARTLALALSQTVPDCSSSQIALNTDAEDGRFNGMSHSGTLLVLRNDSTTACRLDPFARIVLKDRRSNALNVAVHPATAFQGPVVKGRPLPMGHGPVVLPIVLAPGAEATASLRWVSGPVFDKNVCVDAAFFSLVIGANASGAPLAAHICGPDAAHVTMTATPLALDPVYKPSQ